MKFSKTLGPNGTVITMISWTIGSWQGWAPDRWLIGFGHLCSRKWSPKGVFLKFQKIVKVRHWEPLKTVAGNGFEKHDKSMKTILENQWLLMFQNH